MRNQKSFHGILAGAVVVLALAAPVAAKTIKVSSNGNDIAGCGNGANPPCKTLAVAIAVASDGDSIVVGPGRYVGATVNKKVQLSTTGEGAAFIGTANLAIVVDGVVVGKLGKGFAFQNAGIFSTANDLTVRGNAFSDMVTGVDSQGDRLIARDNSFDNCGTGVASVGDDALIRGNRFGYISVHGVRLGGQTADVRDNRFFGPSSVAVYIDGTNHLIRRNLVHGTGGGGFVSAAPGTPTNVQLVENLAVSTGSTAFNITTGTGWLLIGNAAIGISSTAFFSSAASTLTLVDNVAIGSSGVGFGIANGAGHVLTNNTAIDNGSDGINLASTVGAGVVVKGGNLYGNGGSQCALNSASPSAVIADKVYWGAPTGPGADPADLTCGTGTITVTNPASKAATVKMPPVK